MNNHRNLPQLAIALTLGISSAAQGGASIIVPAAEDESVNGGFVDKNYADNLNRGGLFVGSDGTGAGPARFYLKFNLPDFIDAGELASATLSGVYCDDLDRKVNGTHRIHFVGADDWSEDTITWANQPGPTFGSPEARFDASTATPGTAQKWNLTEVVRGELKGDGILSLMFAAENEGTDRSNTNWEYFAEREFDPTRAFSLTLATTTGVSTGGPTGPVAVPLPPAAWPALITLGGTALVMVRKRLKRVTSS